MFSILIDSGGLGLDGVRLMLSYSLYALVPAGDTQEASCCDYRVCTFDARVSRREPLCGLVLHGYSAALAGQEQCCGRKHSRQPTNEKVVSAWDVMFFSLPPRRMKDRALALAASFTAIASTTAMDLALLLGWPPVAPSRKRRDSCFFVLHSVHG